MALAEKLAVGQVEQTKKLDVSVLAGMSVFITKIGEVNLRELRKKSPEEIQKAVCTVLETTRKAYVEKKYERTVGQLDEIIAAYRGGQIGLDNILKGAGLVKEEPPKKNGFTLFNRNK